LERLAAGSTLTLFHRLTVSNSETAEPVADSRYRDTTFVCNVLLVTPFVHVLLGEPFPLLVARLPIDVVSVEPSADST
jgi:hypothetical protein